MKPIQIKKGLNVPIQGEPEQVISEGNIPQTVALLGEDYVGMRPTMEVKLGDKVKLGQLLFTDKKMPNVQYTSPGAGKVTEINRGAKRKFLSVVIQLEGEEEETFNSYTDAELESLSRQRIIDLLVESGLWTSLRTRPFSKVANPDSTAHSIFITAMDTHPLAPDVEKILEPHRKDFMTGLKIISKLTEGKIHLCKSPGAVIPTVDIHNISQQEFAGPHPAGLAGTHIHFLDPVGRNRTVWYINAQDVVAFGLLFSTGRIQVERIISLAGPLVKNPRLIRTRLGASLKDVVKDELVEGDNRMISGSVLGGRHGESSVAYLGRYHQQITVLSEGRERKFLGWLSPGRDFYSIKKVLISGLTPRKKFNFTTTLHGGYRSIVPIGSYEKVMPLDILPTYLLRAISVTDVEEAENLGCLELDEEDLALCTFVCPSKIDHGTNLRNTLTSIEKEG